MTSPLVENLKQTTERALNDKEAQARQGYVDSLSKLEPIMKEAARAGKYFIEVYPEHEAFKAISLSSFVGLARQDGFRVTLAIKVRISWEGHSIAQPF